MYRSFDISVPAAATDELLASLERLDQVASLSVEPGASVKPPGDVIRVCSLNSDAGEVLRSVDGATSTARSRSPRPTWPALIFVLGAGVMGMKQALVHRRTPSLGPGALALSSPRR